MRISSSPNGERLASWFLTTAAFAVTLTEKARHSAPKGFGTAARSPANNPNRNSDSGSDFYVKTQNTRTQNTRATKTDDNDDRQKKRKEQNQEEGNERWDAHKDHEMKQKKKRTRWKMEEGEAGVGLLASHGNLTRHFWTWAADFFSLSVRLLCALAASHGVFFSVRSFAEDSVEPLRVPECGMGSDFGRLLLLLFCFWFFGHRDWLVGIDRLCRPLFRVHVSSNGSVELYFALWLRLPGRQSRFTIDWQRIDRNGGTDHRPEPPTLAPTQ